MSDERRLQLLSGEQAPFLQQKPAEALLCLKRAVRHAWLRQRKKLADDALPYSSTHQLDDVRLDGRQAGERRREPSGRDRGKERAVIGNGVPLPLLGR